MTSDKPLRILVVDDTLLYRKIVCDVLAELPGVEVVGTAHNGRSAMSKITSLKPDLLTLDIQMPEMNGLEVLDHMSNEAPDVGAIMLSTFTIEGGKMTIKALELGAFDFIPKPQTGSMEENHKTIKETIGPMLRAFSRSKEIKSILKGKHGPHSKPAALSGFSRSHLREVARPAGPVDVVRCMNAISGQKRERSEIVAIGISTGGPNALAQMMPKIPSDLGVAILIAQHMPPVFTRALAKSLDSKCAIEVKEAADGERVRPNTAMIAPGGKHMKAAVGADAKTRIVRITDDPPENSCKPSVDYLFRSIAHLYGSHATGVIMTGMGSDGTLGLKLMKRNGATVIAQDKATCVVYGMPKEPAEAGIVDVIAPLDRIAEEIMKTIRH